MSILVTGGAGYVGSVAVEQLHAAGEAVVVLDDLVRGHRAALDSDIPLYEGSVGDRVLVARILREHPIESCIHFAAMAYVAESMSDPAAYFQNNVAQAIDFLGELISHGVRRLVFSSSCAVYGEPERIPIDEHCRLWPVNPYGWSKLFIERVLDSFDRAYGLKFVALRYFNAAGATDRCGEDHDPEPHLIPSILSVALGKQSRVAIYGDSYPTPDGTSVRDYVHVSDLAVAHQRALHYLREKGQSDYLNLGSERGSSVLEVVRCAGEITGKAIPVQVQASRPGDPSRLVADTTRARAMIGWKPDRSDLYTILLSAWRWHQQHPKGYGAR